MYSSTVQMVITDITNNPSLSDARLIQDVSQINGINLIYVDAGATGSNNGSSWGNAYTTIQGALNAASN